MKLHLSLALTLTALACAALGGGAAAGQGHGQLYIFKGEVLTAPGPNATSLSLQVEGGNKAALRALIGASQNEVFSLGSGTRVMIWSHGVPHVGTTADLQQGDWVAVRVRAAHNASLQQIASQQAAAVVESAKPNGGRPLWLFIGTVSGPQSGGHIALHVTSGNWKALQAMLGQSLDQSFAYDNGTIFLLWQGGVPTVISPSQLQAGDRINVRIRAPRSSTLAQVEAQPAARVGDHEPAPAPQQ